MQTVRERLKAALNSVNQRKLHASPIQAIASIEEIVKKILAEARATGAELPSKDEVIAMVDMAFDAIIAGFSNPFIKMAAPMFKAVLNMAVGAIYDKLVPPQHAPAV